MAHSVTIQGRTLAIVCVYNNLDPHQSGSLYDIEPNGALMDKYPNTCIIPMIHNVDVHRTEHLPLIIINFATDDISFSKGEIMGFMQIQSLELSEIITETSTEPSSITYEDNVNEVLNESEGEIKMENVEKKFITSPADIEVQKMLNYRMLIYLMNNNKPLRTCVQNLMTYFQLIPVI